MEGCDGDANAMYGDGVITICYEYVDEFWKNMTKRRRTPAGIAPIDAVVGPLFDIALHEFGHALFDMLKLPVFGREEDAADQVSAYMMLHLGKAEARRLILGHRLRSTSTEAGNRLNRAGRGEGVLRRARHAGAAFVQSVVHRLRRRREACSATWWRRDICRRKEPRAAKTNTSRSPMLSKS